MWVVILGVLASCFGCFMNPFALAEDPAQTRIGRELDSLPLPGMHYPKVTYRVDPYIKAAAALQALGKEEALRELGDFAERNRLDIVEGNSAYRTEPLYILCRMLFVQRKNIPFRRPGLGAGKEDPKRNPLEPIHLINGVPFLTFQHSYLLVGAPEDPTNYLLFCITHCDWSPFRFAPKSRSEKRAALEKLLKAMPEFQFKQDELEAQLASP